MANVTSRGSGDSGEINEANFRRKLDSAKSDVEIGKVVIRILQNPAIQSSIRNDGLTLTQQRKLIPVLLDVAEEGQTKGGQRIAPKAVDEIRRLVVFANHVSEAKIKELADAIHEHCKALNQHGLKVIKWVKSSNVPGLDTANIEQNCSGLQELAKVWGKGGTKRVLFIDLVKKGDQRSVEKQLSLSRNAINNALVQLDHDVKDLLKFVAPNSVDGVRLEGFQRDCSDKGELLSTAFDQVTKILERGK